LSASTESSSSTKPETREFSKETQAEFEAMAKRYAQLQAALLPTLRLVERDFGCIDDGGMALAAKLCGVSPAYVLGVVTFYTHYKRPSDGKHVIEICRTLPCALRGADALAAHAEKTLGLHMGATSEDRQFTLKSVECLAACDQAPCLQLDGDFRFRVSNGDFDELVDGLKK